MRTKPPTIIGFVRSVYLCCFVLLLYSLFGLSCSILLIDTACSQPNILPRAYFIFDLVELLSKFLHSDLLLQRFFLHLCDLLT